MDKDECQDDYYADELENQRLRKSRRIVCAFVVIIMASWSLLYILTQPIQSKVEFVLYKDDFEQICTSDDCVRMSATLKSSMEPSVDPCEDFFQFSCGKWLRAHKKSSEIRIAGDILDARIWNMLKSPRNAKDIEIIKQVKMLYESCRDKGVDPDLPGFEVSKQILKEFGLPTVPRIFTNDNGSVNWIKSEIAFQKVFSDGAFLEFDLVDYNLSSTIRMTVKHINRSKIINLKNPIGDEYEEDIHDNFYNHDYDIYKKIDDFGQDAVEQYLRSVSVTPGKEKIHIIVTRLEEIKEKFIIQQMTSDGSAEELYAIDSFEESLTAAGIAISDNWKECISLLKNPKFSESKRVLVNLKRVNAVFELINDSDGDFVELFLWINVMKTVKYHYNTSLNLEEHYIARARSDALDVLDEACLDIAKEDMGLVITYSLANDYLNGKARVEMKTMINNILNVYRDVLKMVYSFDKNKLDYLIGKMEIMDLYLGYPDWVSDLNKLEEHYKKINLSSTDFKGNLLQLKYLVPNFKKDYNLFTIYDIYNPIVVNAYYDDENNTIVFPMGAFAFPFYHLGLTSLNYGSIGFIVGHEITHAMEATTGLSENFNVINCINKQYVTQYGDDAMNDAVLKEHENLADIGGIYLTFEAYRRYKTNASLIEKKLVGFQEYTEEQMLFMSYANLLCGVDEVNHKDSHSAHSYRILAPLKNSYEFSEAFNCPLGSGMNPDRIRCTLF